MKAGRSKKGANSRDRILQAALQEFAHKGIDGARVDEIARVSGANKNMIYHYFRSKENLFVAVLESVYENVRSRQQDLSLRDLDPVAAMRRLIEHTADIWIEVPEFNRLLASENLHQAKHVRRSKKIQSMYSPLIDTLKGILERGVKDGVFRDGVDPVDLYISVTSLSAHYVAHHFTFDAIFKTNLMSPKKIAQRKSTISAMILRYLQP
ncbi:MAG: TetR/AcrR family transcriptional regulator [Alphaproteobacteria bacterium]|nr:MAG: TetR/AcrR family transcriptional regulator [Alphaproteobacteria bacterium]